MGNAAKIALLVGNVASIQMENIFNDFLMRSYKAQDTHAHGLVTDRYIDHCYIVIRGYESIYG